MTHRRDHAHLSGLTSGGPTFGTFQEPRCRNADLNEGRNSESVGGHGVIRERQGWNDNPGPLLGPNREFTRLISIGRINMKRKLRDGGEWVKGYSLSFRSAEGLGHGRDTRGCARVVNARRPVPHADVGSGQRHARLRRTRYLHRNEQ